MGCAVASAAMLGEMSYDEALARWPVPDVAWTRDPQHMLALLQVATETEWELFSANLPTVCVNDLLSYPWPVAAWIQDAAIRARHAQWIVIDDQIIHDPSEHVAWAKRSYPRRDWFIGMIAQPVRPEVVFEVQTQRQADRIAQRWQPGSTACQCLESDAAPNHRPGPSRPALQLRPALQFQGYFIGERDLASAPAVLVSCAGCGRPTESGTVCDVCSAG
jgi:hypothetical protein